MKSRYSERTGEVPSKHDDNRLRRTAPADVGPLSVKKLRKLYDEGRERPDMAAHDHKDLQKNQDRQDQHDNSKHGRYDNDVPETSWLRGGGRGGEDRPTFDRGKFDKSNDPGRWAPGGPPNTGDGADMTRSPFSAANRTRRDENDWNPNLKLKPLPGK